MASSKPKADAKEAPVESKSKKPAVSEQVAHQLKNAKSKEDARAHFADVE